MRSALHLAVLSFCLTATAQTTWTVNPPASLDQVFANAAPGDIVLLGAGTYVPFTLQKGLTVLGPATIQGVSGPVGPWDTVVNVPAGQHARFVGLSFQWTLQPQWAVPLAGHQVSVTGDASFEDCQFGSGQPKSLVIVSGGVLLQRCTVLGGNSLGGGFDLRGGYCSMSDCTVQGLNGGTLSTNNIYSGPGASVTGGTLVASHTTFSGGDGAVGYPFVRIDPSPGIQCSGGTTRVFLADSTVIGGSGVSSSSWPGLGAVGLEASTAHAVEIARTTLQGGAGAFPGAASTGSVQNVPTIVGLRMDHGLIRGQTSTATATAGSSQQLLAILATFATTRAAVPAVVEPVFGMQAQAFTLVLAVPGPGAQIPAVLAVPNSIPLRGVAVWLQTLQYDGNSSWRASAVVGGTVR